MPSRNCFFFVQKPVVTGFVLLMVAVIGCEGGSSTKSGNSGPSNASSASQSDTANKTAKPKMTVDLAKITVAKKLTLEVCTQISFMSSDTAFEASRTGKDNALGIIDIAAAKNGIGLIATLPDNTENEFIKPLSEIVPKIQEVFSLYEQAVTSGKPFSDGSEVGPKMAKLAADFHLQLSVAIDESLKLTEQK